MSETTYSSEPISSEKAALAATFDGLWERSRQEPEYFESQGIVVGRGFNEDTETQWASFTRFASLTHYQRVILTRDMVGSRSVIGEQQCPSIEHEGYMQTLRLSSVTTLDGPHPIETKTVVQGRLLDSGRLANEAVKDFNVNELVEDRSLGQLNDELIAFTTPAEKIQAHTLGQKVMKWLGFQHAA